MNKKIKLPPGAPILDMNAPDFAEKFVEALGLQGSNEEVQIITSPHKRPKNDSAPSSPPEDWADILRDSAAPPAPDLDAAEAVRPETPLPWHYDTQADALVHYAPADDDEPFGDMFVALPLTSEAKRQNIDYAEAACNERPALLAELRRFRALAFDGLPYTVIDQLRSLAGTLDSAAKVYGDVDHLRASLRSHAEAVRALEAEARGNAEKMTAPQVKAPPAVEPVRERALHRCPECGRTWTRPVRCDEGRGLDHGRSRVPQERSSGGDHDHRRDGSLSSRGGPGRSVAAVSRNREERERRVGRDYLDHVHRQEPAEDGGDYIVMDIVEV